MNRGPHITYDREADAFYILLRDAKPVSQREFSDDIILDLDADKNLIGIEVLDTGADLAELVREFGLDPHLLEVLDKMRGLIPETDKQLVLA